jgi:glutamate 5-kinase
MASIIYTVRETKSHKKQNSRKYGSIVGLGGIETKPSADIIARNKGVTTIHLLGAS